MPITTLQNISIPTEGANSNSSLLMPKLQYRFRVFLDNFGTTGGPDGVREISRQVQDVTRPNVSFEQMQIDSYNSRAYLAGKHTWEPVTLTLREDANNNVQKIIGQQLQRQFDFFEQSSAVSSGSYKFQTRIEILQSLAEQTNLTRVQVETVFDALNKSIEGHMKKRGSGEFTIGISWPGRAIKVIKAGAPIDMIIPEEGIGWEMQVVAIMKGTDNLEDAKTLMDWTLGDGMKLFGERQSIIADSSKVTKDPELPDFYDEVQAKLINNDFVWAAANKDRIVAEWKKRYDGKTEPKS